MMGVSHLLASGTACSLALSTTDPTTILVGAVAGLLPDIDISSSWAGRMFPWISHYLERRFPHRSCTHSLLASCAVGAASLPVALLLGNSSYTLIYAFNIGYFCGWFVDVFTQSGVEMFYPSPVRCVCPGNRNYRLRTGSNTEYMVLAALTIIAFVIFNINSGGGIFIQFNRFIASPSGVLDIYNSFGANHLIAADITGVRASDRSQVKEKYIIIQSHGQGFLVQSTAGEIYKAGSEPDAQIVTKKIIANVGSRAITNIQALALEEELLEEVLAPFSRVGAMVFVSGQISVDDPESANLLLSPHEFPTIRASSAGNITLEAAPLALVLQTLTDQFATGQLQVKSIHVQTPTTTNPQTNSTETPSS